LHFIRGLNTVSFCLCRIYGEWLNFRLNERRAPNLPTHHVSKSLGLTGLADDLHLPPLQHFVPVSSRKLIRISREKTLFGSHTDSAQITWPGGGVEYREDHATIQCLRLRGWSYHAIIVRHKRQVWLRRQIASQLSRVSSEVPSITRRNLENAGNGLTVRDLDFEISPHLVVQASSAGRGSLKASRTSHSQ